MSLIDIISAKAEDAKVIENIKVKSWQYTYDNILPNDYLHSLDIELRSKKTRKRIESQDSRKYFILNYKEIPVGVISYSIDFNDKEEKIGTIYDLYFLPEYTGKGFGGRAYFFLKNYFFENDCYIIYCYVIKGNERSKQFLTKLGFYSTNNTSMKLISDKTIIFEEFRLNL